MNIVWDFDGTILPMVPYDSEQTLLEYLLEIEDGISPVRRVFIKMIMYADMKGWLGHFFKPMYIKAVRGMDISAIDTVTNRLADRISTEDRDTLKKLYLEGHRMVLISCGTENLSKLTFKKAGIDIYFKDIIANNFTFKGKNIHSMEFRTLKPIDKLNIIRDMGFKPEETVVVGDGPTDIPLFEWCNFPVIIDRDGRRAKKFAGRNFHIVSRVSDILPLVDTFLKGSDI